MFLVRECGYADLESCQYERLAADITRRATGRIEADQLRAILSRGRDLKAFELVTICQGLDIEAYDVLYDEGIPPDRKRRPKGKGLLDMVEKPL